MTVEDKTEAIRCDHPRIVHLTKARTFCRQCGGVLVLHQGEWMPSRAKMREAEREGFLPLACDKPKD